MSMIMHDDDDLLNFVWDCSIIEYFKEEENCDDYESVIKHFSDEDEYEIHIQYFG